MGIVPLLILINKASISGSGARFPQPVPEERGRDDVSLASSQKSGFSFRSIWTSFLQDKGAGKVPNTSSKVRNSFFSRRSRFRLSIFCRKSSSAWRLLLPHAFLFCGSAVSAGTELSSH